MNWESQELSETAKKLALFVMLNELLAAKYSSWSCCTITITTFAERLNIAPCITKSRSKIAFSSKSHLPCHTLQPKSQHIHQKALTNPSPRLFRGILISLSSSKHPYRHHHSPRHSPRRRSHTYASSPAHRSFRREHEASLQLNQAGKEQDSAPMRLRLREMQNHAQIAAESEHDCGDCVGGFDFFGYWGVCEGDGGDGGVGKSGGEG